MEYCNTQVVNAHFNRREVTKVNPKGWYGSYLGWKYRLQAYLIRFSDEQNSSISIPLTMKKHFLTQV